jgi:hypothetical protein
MLDFCPGEEIFFTCYVQGTPDVLRLKFVRPSRHPCRTRNRVWLVAQNDKGTEITCPLRYVFKCREDAQEKAEEMTRGRS